MRDAGGSSPPHPCLVALSIGFSLSWPVAHKRACLRATMSAAGRKVVFLVVVVLFFNALILLPYFK